MYSVAIKNISKRFGTTPVLHDISCTIKEGELFFLLGPSGCGKTTLLRIIAGFETPDTGTLHFNAINALKLPPQKRNASLVFQNYALWPHLTVLQNIAFGLENRSLSKSVINAKTKAIIEMVRMDGFEKRYPHQLSGGQQQRIALARALVVEPDLLLLDEPLSNLDARLRSDMRIELARLHKRTGVTALYVTHDQDEALSLADRIGFMDNGRLLQCGSPRELYARPGTTTLARFLGHATILNATVTSISKDIVTVQTPLGELQGIHHSTSSIKNGQSVYCFIRPENLHRERIINESNVLTGKTTTILYTGSTEQIYIENNGVQFMAVLPSNAIITAPDTELTFYASITDTIILTE